MCERKNERERERMKSKISDSGRRLRLGRENLIEIIALSKRQRSPLTRREGERGGGGKEIFQVRRKDEKKEKESDSY